MTTMRGSTPTKPGLSGALRALDPIDKASLPIFAVTMIAEHAVLRRRRTRALDPLNSLGGIDLDEAAKPDDPAHPDGPDALIPVGYERKDTTASLLMLVGNVTIGFATLGIINRLNNAVFKRRVSNIGAHRGALASAMVVWDLLYYWDHRLQHEVRGFWANHVTHHSGRRYNLSTALRQPWSGLSLAWIFLPMPLLGYKGSTTMRAGQLNLLYQYWIHTEVIDRLPTRVEAVFNTPSHHRVHHGANREYLDKNYGGILIVWDKMFGTFQPEVRRVRYGLTKNISTYNPFRIAYHEYASIVRDVAKSRNWRDALGYVARRPGWKPSPVGG